MGERRYVYITYIRTTPELLWAELTRVGVALDFWMGCRIEGVMEPGAGWRLLTPDGRAVDEGEVIEVDAPKRLVLRWRHRLFEALRDGPETRCTFELESHGDMVKLTLLHEAETESKFVAAVADGWPIILASLKSKIETGEPLAATRGFPEGL